jgi:hypothetical protein
MGVSRYGLAVSRSGYGCECMDWLYVDQDRGVSVWNGCINVRIGV